jgi:hypothetical protein
MLIAKDFPRKTYNCYFFPNFEILITWHNRFSFVDSRHEAKVDGGVHDGNGVNFPAEKCRHQQPDFATFRDAANVDAGRRVDLGHRGQVVDGLFEVIEVKRLPRKEA